MPRRYCGPVSTTKLTLLDPSRPFQNLLDPKRDTNRERASSSACTALYAETGATALCESELRRGSVEELSAF
eukprot:2979935-Rhodomonas_salina.3